MTKRKLKKLTTDEQKALVLAIAKAQPHIDAYLEKKGVPFSINDVAPPRSWIRVVAPRKKSSVQVTVNSDTSNLSATDPAEHIKTLERNSREDFALRVKLEDRIIDLERHNRNLEAVLVHALGNTKK